MNSEHDIEVLNYLLDQMDPAERRAFESRLEADAGLAEAVRGTREAMAEMAVVVAPPEAMDVGTQRVVLAGILAAMEPTAGNQPAVILKRWWWPIAAAGLLGLNVWRWTRARLESDPVAPSGGGSVAGAQVASGGGANKASSGAEVESAEELAEREGELVAGKSIMVSADEWRRWQAMREQLSQLQREHRSLNVEHTTTLRKLAQMEGLDRAVNRLAAMELVDPERYAAGERNGLLDFALTVLTEPGIVALSPEGPSASNDGGSATGDANATDDAAADVANGGSTGTDTTENDGAAERDTESVKDPYAWSVYDEKSDRGFLNLYDLPMVPTGTSLELWVRPSPDSDFVYVGTVPERYYGGSGSLSYSVPGMSQPPAEILVSREASGAVPRRPAGPTILRGP